MSAKSKKPIAALVSDIHLSDTAPIARSNESDWIAVQEGYLSQWLDLKKKYKVTGIIAGDIFDKYKGSPTLINVAMDYLEGDLAIPGQHDLPYHDYNEMKKSAFGVLVRGGTIRLINPEEPLMVTSDLYLHGFPWGHKITPLDRWIPDFDDSSIHLAVIHAYCWHKQHSFVGAEKRKNAVAYKKQLKGYDAAIFGDNHKGFLIKSGDTTILNNGGFVCRKIDEIDYQPCMGLLFSDGSIERVPVDCSQDKWVNTKTLKEMVGEIEGVDIGGFIQELEQLGDTGLDYRLAINTYFNKKGVSKPVRKIITEILDNYE